MQSTPVPTKKHGSPHKARSRAGTRHLVGLTTRAIRALLSPAATAPAAAGIAELIQLRSR
ncbi:hypothetical protein [Streptomyces sp. NRRL B-1347]|uniref:hypothetical protein n=1 Tax=Streptomyces sp. NRRL B-1347 TaxID=1476877 RepID=UPI00131AD7F8|nr:hypothetical protein [Streptomyces sp. NRRL B-1347]